MAITVLTTIIVNTAITKDNPVLNNIEEWKPIYGFEWYEVSSLGQVRNAQKRILKPCKHSMGYRKITIYRDKKAHQFLIHRLVAIAFLPNPNGLPIINHKDGDKLNNNTSNIEWCDNSHNISHARETGLNPYNKPTAGKKLGGKRKAKSNFYGVGFDNSRQKWIGYLRYNNKLYKQRRFASEIEAAQHYNSLLDELNITDRPRNNV